MSIVTDKIIDAYFYIFEDSADPRVKSFFLMSSPFPALCIVAFYFYFIFDLGPQLMKNRPPFNLDKVLIGYNIIQIVACLYFIVQLLFTTIPKYSLICEPIDYSDDEFPMYVAGRVWYYFMLKLFDLLDTVFFVLRKKNNQITFLHVYHHVGMCFLGWGAVKYIAGGHGMLIGFINCIVHSVMYFYYLLSAWDKEYKKNVWWKKHITQLQLLQFFIVMVYYGQILFQPNCSYPKWTVWILVPQNFLIIMLFLNFYIKTYIKPQEKPTIKCENPPANGHDLQNDKKSS